MSRLERLHPGLQRWIKEQGWPGLRPIQEAAMDPILAGDSCVLEAPTAGGKTEAVLFPTLTRAAENPSDSVQVLYIAPLRALLNNLETRGEDYATCCALHAFKWHGDVSQSKKVESLKAPPQLLLTTPESIEAILLRKPGWHRFFHALDTVIIDEAHNFAGGDRGGHLIALLDRLEGGVGRSLQRIALSATIGNPDAMCRWLTGHRKPARRIQVATTHKQKNDFQVQYFDAREDTDSTPIADRAAMRLLRSLVGELKGNRGITFVRSRSKAEDIAKAVQQFSGDRIKVRTHHSNISKFFREEAESQIQQAGEQGIEAIISTSTLELGIDIGELDRIIQLGALASPSAFLQRVGRTGRRPGKPRHFRGLTQDEDELLLLTATVSLGVEHDSESLRLRRRAFHLLAHQVLCVSLQYHGVSANKAWEILSGGYAFSGIERAEYDRLIAHMQQEDYLREADGVLVPGLAAEKRYLTGSWRNLFAVFSTAPLYEVLEGRTQVGTLDTSFVESLEVPFYFILAGRLWKAWDVDLEHHVIKASRAKDGTVPHWESFGGPDVPLETSQRVGEFLYGYRSLPDFLDESARRRMETLCHESPPGGGWSPEAIECHISGGGRAILRTFAGDTLNRTLGKLIESQGTVVSGNYAGLEIKKGPDDPDEFRQMLRETFERLAEDRDMDHCMDVLNRTQKPFFFSPFKPMLPDEFTRAALVDQNTDLPGLQAFLARRI
ncbi:DEAD/DEAH box helicase [Marinimicrobium locisalis]|uniref:DEAD/DEAH box helicase n=1 Tax=Marinimicrobium locisalis TaxID=546022 RepID=UPI003221B35C